MHEIEIGIHYENPLLAINIKQKFNKSEPIPYCNASSQLQTSLSYANLEGLAL